MIRLSASSFVVTFAARLVASVLGIVAGILTARVFGPQGKGAFAAVQLLIGFAVTLATGVGVALTHAITKKQIRPGELLLPAAILFAFISLGTTAAGAVYLIVEGRSAIVLAATLAAPGSILLTWQLGYLSALGLLRTLNVQVVVCGVLALLAIGSALVLHTGIDGFLLAWAAVTSIAAAIFTVTCARVAGGVVRISTRTRVRELVSFGMQSSANSFLGWLTYRVDAMLIGAMLGLSAFGIYSVATNLAEALLMISRTAPTVLTKDIGTRDVAASARISARAIRAITAMLCLVAAVAWFAVPWVVQAFYGTRFDGAVLPFRILLPGVVTFATVGTFCAFFIFQLGRPSIVTWLNFVTIAIQAALCFLLIPHYGLSGAALASSLTYAAGTVYCTVLFCSATNLSPSDVWLLNASDIRFIANALRRRRSGAGSSQKPLLLVTGAAGRIGTLLRPLLRQYYRLRLCDRVAIGALSDGETFACFDLAHERALDRAVRGVDGIVHLAGCPGDADFHVHAKANIALTYSVFEAARRNGIERVVFASTGHVTGFYRKDSRIGPEAPPRPDSIYGAAKAFCEALASMYADKFGMRIFTIRVGHCSEVPVGALDRAIWISPRDLMQLVRIGLVHRDVRNEIVYGVSRNRAGFWDTSKAADFGYAPQDSADDAPLSQNDVRATSIFQGDYRANVASRAIADKR